MNSFIWTPEFKKWLLSLKSGEQIQVTDRLNRIKNDNHFGDAKYLGNGWRIYFSKKGNSIIVLLVGGHKNAQEKDIKKARLLLRRYANS